MADLYGTINALKLTAAGWQRDPSREWWWIDPTTGNRYVEEEAVLRLVKEGEATDE